MKNMLLLVFLAVVLLSCQHKTKVTSTQKKESIPTIFVSNYPLQFFTQSIAGQKVKIIFPAKDSDDPASWQPKPEQISSIQNADLIILNGASYEKWIENVSVSTSKIVNTTAKLTDKLITYKESLTHSHGPEGEHAHMGTAFTTWLDFSLARLQAKTIYESLIAHYPENKELFLSNYQNLDKELSLLDKQFLALNSKNKNATLVFSHPVYQYFQQRYGIPGHSVHWEPHMEITSEMWQDLEQNIDDHATEWMVWEDKPLASSISFLQEKQIKSVVFNPCGNIPQSGNFLTVMKDNLIELEKVFN
jgi:zinc transport system substrate-binding protein